MKKFQFSLETVLDYKQQVLDSVQVEHGAIVAQVRQQEEVLLAAEERYKRTNLEFCEKKTTGLTIADAMGYEVGLRVLEQEIFRETLKLEELRQQEAAKREELVSCKVDTTSLEKLKEKKLAGYNKATVKSEELFIDELVSSTRRTGFSTSLIS